MPESLLRMTVHQVNQILTFDRNDFKRYDGIIVVHPAEIK
jgi:hypothetical protein